MDRTDLGIVFDRLEQYFERSAVAFPLHDALVIGGKRYSFSEINERSGALARELAAFDNVSSCCFLAERTVNAFVVILAILKAGLMYVPLNVRFPVARNAVILKESRAELLLVDVPQRKHAEEVLEIVEHSLSAFVLDFDKDQLQPLRCESAIQSRNINYYHEKSLNEYAYLLFTSGSTGQPKGIGITHKNVCGYVARTIQTISMGPEDRATQLFEFSFDLHVHDLFVTWAVGACLFVPTKQDLMFPGNFVRANNLSHWFSVPSMASILLAMERAGTDGLRSLRCSLFCGEPLSLALAESWARAAPNSRIYNLYGPTEATIAFTRYEFCSGSFESSFKSIIPIGRPLPEQEAIVMDDQQQPVARGVVGELWLGGDQLANGYWNASENTRSAFIRKIIPGFKSDRWYRTGDYARLDQGNILHFHGRRDQQVKVRGYRIELVEVEGAVSSMCEAGMVAALPIQSDTDANLQKGIALFYKASNISETEMMVRCNQCLPPHLVPDRVIKMSEFPLNSSGKVDRVALMSFLAHAKDITN